MITTLIANRLYMSSISLRVLTVELNYHRCMYYIIFSLVSLESTSLYCHNHFHDRFFIVQESPLLKPYMNQCGKLWSSSDCASSMPRLLEYCNIDKPRGSEGDVYNSREHDNSYIRDFELVHLLITIRHGDRTTLNKIAGSDSLNKSIDKYKSSNGPIESKLLEPQVLRHIDSCKKLDLNYTPAVLGQPSHNPLHSSNLFTVPGK